MRGSWLVWRARLGRNVGARRDSDGCGESVPRDPVHGCVRSRRPLPMERTEEQRLVPLKAACDLPDAGRPRARSRTPPNRSRSSAAPAVPLRASVRTARRNRVPDDPAPARTNCPSAGWRADVVTRLRPRLAANLRVAFQSVKPYLTRRCRRKASAVETRQRGTTTTRAKRAPQPQRRQSLAPPAPERGAARERERHVRTDPRRERDPSRPPRAVRRAARAGPRSRRPRPRCRRPCPACAGMRLMSRKRAPPGRPSCVAARAPRRAAPGCPAPAGTSPGAPRAGAARAGRRSRGGRRSVRPRARALGEQRVGERDRLEHGDEVVEAVRPRAVPRASPRFSLARAATSTRSRQRPAHRAAYRTQATAPRKSSHRDLDRAVGQQHRRGILARLRDAHQVQVAEHAVGHERHRVEQRLGVELGHRGGPDRVERVREHACSAAETVSITSSSSGV